MCPQALSGQGFGDVQELEDMKSARGRRRRRVDGQALVCSLDRFDFDGPVGLQVGQGHDAALVVDRGDDLSGDLPLIKSVRCRPPRWTSRSGPGRDS